MFILESYAQYDACKLSTKNNAVIDNNVIKTTTNNNLNI